MSDNQKMPAKEADEAPKKPKQVTIVNRTGQKQVAEIDNTQLILTAYGSIKVSIPEDRVREALAVYIDNGILQIQ